MCSIFMSGFRALIVFFSYLSLLT
uniref:Uncharacterized protein n=1 Tax=Rhizophora mucronata TaxID=61149 RepID=A0A2P2PHM5_RHIMU